MIEGAIREREGRMIDGWMDGLVVMWTERQIS